MIKGQEVFEPVSDADSAHVGVPAGVEELRALDHLLKRNREGKKALAEALLHLGLSSSAVERILHLESDGERPVSKEATRIHEDIDLVQQGGLGEEEISVSCYQG